MTKQVEAVYEQGRLRPLEPLQLPEGARLRAILLTRDEASMERGGELASAAAELRTDNFKQWAGGVDIATVVIVLTDIVGSTKLNVGVGDDHWQQVLETHFARAKELIKSGHGFLIKTIGDSVMAAFHSASDALDFALALQRDTGHESVRIRAGIHIGPIEETSTQQTPAEILTEIAGLPLEGEAAGFSSRDHDSVLYPRK